MAAFQNNMQCFLNKAVEQLQQGSEENVKLKVLFYANKKGKKHHACPMHHMDKYCRLYVISKVIQLKSLTFTIMDYCI